MPKPALAYRWTVLPVKGEGEEISLARSLNISRVLARILLQRGVDDYESAKAFFRPQAELLHDPYQMKDMEKAVRRIQEALESDEKILVYGDYDVDGTTSVTLMVRFFNQLGVEVESYTPDRHNEGYGISMQGIDHSSSLGVNLIIALDCGIRAIEQAKKCNDLGIDLIICDHHLPGPTLPNAFAILNPKQPNCSYPFKELSGCGIGFKLTQALSYDLDLENENWMNQLDLVAISIASDLVSMTGENRVLAALGLRRILEGKNPGIVALMTVSGLAEKASLNISNIVFGLGPRINACGRMDHGNRAIELLSTRDYGKAREIAAKVNSLNSNRQGFDKAITQEALDMIELKDPNHENKLSLLYNPDWHLGVLGIVASRCIEKVYRPTIILGQKDEFATGSARSVSGIDMFQALSSASELMEKWGGHKYAAGLSILPDRIEELEERLNIWIKENSKEEDFIPEIRIDSELELEEISPKFISVLKQMEPFGPDNKRPVFISKGVRMKKGYRILKEEHLKANFYQSDSGTAVEAIGFGKAELIQGVDLNQKWDICYSLSENEFRGNVTIQMELKDMKPSENDSAGGRPHQEIQSAKSSRSGIGQG